MTAGTRPAARSLRATPLPVSVRASALRDADAMKVGPDWCLFDCSEPRSRCYSQAAASALPCRLAQSARSRELPAVNGFRFSVHVSEQELGRRDRMGVPADNRSPITDHCALARLVK